MLAFFLLSGIPVISALLFGYMAMRVLRTPWLVRLIDRGLYFIVNVGLIGLSLTAGAIIGLLLTVQINRIVYNYEVLKKALPTGIYLWYGFGPDLTPQFYNYWRLVMVVIVIATPYMALLNLRRKNSILDFSDR
jgi:hypothetical protein